MRRENVLIANRPSVRGSATHHRCPVTKPSSEHSQNVVALMQVAGSLTQKGSRTALQMVCSYNGCRDWCH